MGVPSCVFPFVFDGKSYKSCTKAGAIDDQLWCGTTANYDEDGQWKHCNSEAKGSSCIFPFTYEGNKYNMCTSDGMSNGTLWCATTSNYDLDKKWMYCDLTEIVESLPCVFPFIHEGKTYTKCTTDGQSDGKLWCATTSSYDVEKKWKFCEKDSDIMAENPFCVFPFIYKGVSYNACTTEGMSDGKLWCANTSNYDIDKKWVYCNVTGKNTACEIFLLFRTSLGTQRCPGY
uniref:Fibronectin type-II domain-containing protein n=1 Tax=Anolis carolinensis TaxID=28377 RepID=H9GGQ9_ANOCA